MSAAQRYAAAAVKDGISEDTLRSIASLATWGKHMSNVERDFHRWLPHVYGTMLETHDTVIDIYDPSTAQNCSRKIPILLASGVLSAIWRRQDETLWATCIGATSDRTERFWTRAQLWASNHPVAQNHGAQMLLLWIFNPTNKTSI